MSDILEGYLDVEELEAKKIQKHNLWNLSKRIFDQPGPFFGGLVCLLVGTAAALSEPRLFGYAIDKAILPGRLDLLKDLSLLYLVLVTTRVSGVVAQMYLFELLGQRVTQALRVELYSHLQRVPISIYDKNPAGRLLTRVTNDVASLGEMFSAGFVSMIGNGLLVLGTLTMLLVLNVKLGLIAAAVFPILMVLSIYFSRKLKITYRDSRSKLSALNAFLAENLLGMKVVHLFNRQKQHLERFDRINNWYAEAQFGTVKIWALFQPAITIAAGISVALVMWYGGKRTWHDLLPLGVLSAYFSYVLALFQPLREIADNWNTFLSGMASAERIFAMLSWPTELDQWDFGKKITPIQTKGHIRFENVWFAYDQEHWVLKDFTLEIRSGQRVGVVGHTGAGKTTLISLLMRFYEPQKGRITLDGRDIRELDKRELRAAIGIIQQDVFLFSGSLKDNITFWNPETAVPDLSSVASIDPAKELEERGSNLSVGERQVLAFSRTLAAKPQIWILDEATSNMDSGTEERLQEALEKSARGKTTLMIAHRLATVKTADLILVLHRGSLVEHGSHEELLKKGGLYSRLYRYQRAQELAPLT